MHITAQNEKVGGPFLRLGLDTQEILVLTLGWWQGLELDVRLHRYGDTEKTFCIGECRVILNGKMMRFLQFFLVLGANEMV
jgi:hypothetical protein